MAGFLEPKWSICYPFLDHHLPIMAWRCLEQPYLSTQKNVWYVEDDLSGDWGCNCCNLLIKSYKKNRTWGLVNRIYWDYQPPSGMMLQVQYENLLTNIGQIYVVIQLKKTCDSSLWHWKWGPFDMGIPSNTPDFPWKWGMWWTSSLISAWFLAVDPFPLDARGISPFQLVFAQQFGDV